MKTQTKLYSALLASMLFCASQAHANLVSNGNFQTGLYANVPGWSLSGAVVVLPYANYGLSGTYAGSSSGALFGYTNVLNDPNLLSQTIATVAGTSYTLTFDYGSYAGNSSLTQSIHASAVDLNSSASLLSNVITTPGSSTSSLNAMFQTHSSFVFTATGSQTTINFSDVSAVTQNVDSFLTNIAVNQIASPGSISVPEPASLALFALGMAGFSFRRKRHCQKTLQSHMQETEKPSHFHDKSTR